MTGRTLPTAEPETPLRRVGLPVLTVAAPGAIAAVWIALTAATGLTFHLFPGVIAGAPAFVWSLLSPRDIRPWRLALLIGWPVVATSWALLEILDILPTATFVHGQPGGVRGEIVVIAAAGAFLAAKLTRTRAD